MKSIGTLIMLSIISSVSFAAATIKSADECKISKKSLAKGFELYNQIDKIIFVPPTAAAGSDVDLSLPVDTAPEAVTLMLSGKSLGGGLVLPVMGHNRIEANLPTATEVSRIKITELYSGQLMTEDPDQTYLLTAMHSKEMVVDHLYSYDFKVSLKNQKTGQVTELLFACEDSEKKK